MLDRYTIVCYIMWVLFDIFLEEGRKMEKLKEAAEGGVIVTLALYALIFVIVIMPSWVFLGK